SAKAWFERIPDYLSSDHKLTVGAFAQPSAEVCPRRPSRFLTFPSNSTISLRHLYCSNLCCDQLKTSGNVEHWRIRAMEVAMHSPYGLEVSESCVNCSVRSEGYFCDFESELISEFESLKYATVFPKGAVLFVEGQSPRGVFMVCTGRVKLTTCSSDGK